MGSRFFDSQYTFTILQSKYKNFFALFDFTSAETLGGTILKSFAHTLLTLRMITSKFDSSHQVKNNLRLSPKIPEED